MKSFQTISVNTLSFLWISLCAVSLEARYIGQQSIGAVPWYRQRQYNRFDGYAQGSLTNGQSRVPVRETVVRIQHSPTNQRSPALYRNSANTLDYQKRGIRQGSHFTRPLFSKANSPSRSYRQPRLSISVNLKNRGINTNNQPPSPAGKSRDGGYMPRGRSITISRSRTGNTLNIKTRFIPVKKYPSLETTPDQQVTEGILPSKDTSSDLNKASNGTGSGASLTVSLPKGENSYMKNQAGNQINANGGVISAQESHKTSHEIIFSTNKHGNREIIYRRPTANGRTLQIKHVRKANGRADVYIDTKLSMNQSPSAELRPSDASGYKTVQLESQSVTLNGGNMIKNDNSVKQGQETTKTKSSSLSTMTDANLTGEQSSRDAEVAIATEDPDAGDAEEMTEEPDAPETK